MKLSDVFQALARENETWNMHIFSVFIPEAISNSWKLRMLLKGTGYFPFDPFLLAHSNIFLYRSQNWDNRAESIWSPVMTSEWIFRRTWDMLWCKTCSAKMDLSQKKDNTPKSSGWSAVLYSDGYGYNLYYLEIQYIYIYYRYTYIYIYLYTAFHISWQS